MIYSILLIRLAALGLVCGAWIFTAAHGVSSHGTRPSLLPGIWGLSSPIRDWTYVPCIARHILNHWATREIPYNILVKIFPKYCMDNTFTKIFEFYEFIWNIYNSRWLCILSGNPPQWHLWIPQWYQTKRKRKKTQRKNLSHPPIFYVCIWSKRSLNLSFEFFWKWPD